VPRSETVTPRLSAVIVNWNTCDLLDDCLISLRAHGDPGMEVVVVDNGSTDGSVEMLADRWSDVQVIVNDTNRGYQAANNQGMRAARGDALLLINADAMLTPGCLEALEARFEADPRAAIVGPRLVYKDGSFQRWTAGRLPSLTAAAGYFFFADRVFPHCGLWLGRDVDVAFQPGWVSSACMLVRRDALTEIGLMDERFFAYMDDVDLCARAADAGWTVWYEPAATSIHLMGQSTKRRTGEASPLALKSFIRWFGMQRGALSVAIFRTMAAMGFTLRAAIYGAAGLRNSHQRAAARAHLANARRSLGPIEPGVTP
jgi:N-acetylglucosaminyl-diphospho-decaprenol L-rhamnosyltransferase